MSSIQENISEEVPSKRRRCSSDQEELADDNCDQVSLFMSQSTGKRSSSKEQSNIRKRKATKHADLIDVLRENTARLVAAIENATEKLCNAILDTELRNKRAKLNSELAKLPGLDSTNRLKAHIKIGCNKGLIELFYILPEEDREAFVLSVMNNGV